MEEFDKANKLNEVEYMYQFSSKTAHGSGSLIH